MSWQDGVYGTDARTAIAPLVESSGGASVPGTLAVSTRPIYLRFDLAPLEEAEHIERAVLSLSPSPAWRPTGEAQDIFARGIVSRWTSESVAAGTVPSLEGSPAGRVRLSGRVRAPVRIDVTGLVRAWVDGATAAEGVSVETTGEGAAFLGMGAMELMQRARLEVVFR